jgi:protein phosphatase 1L|tara:strand:+ start:794 stop:1672 length:879 start_codon:yes stop_codon:yes gene_type:complete
MQMQLATERELEDASLAEEVTVVQGRTFALSSKRGKRRFSCEDAYQAAPGLDGDPTRGIFSVFDGHGGREAADYAADNLHDNILREINRVESSLDLDEFTEQVKAAMIEGFLATDQEFLSLGDLQGGATATTAYLSKGRIWVANVGDCRAVICQGGEAVALTHDHRPDCAKEREAVERRGGEIVRERVQGVLGVSRALGDRELKSYITAEPSVFCGPVSESSEFLILGTDGLWDHVDNQEAVQLVRLALDEKRGIHAACRGLVELARANRSRDDISVLVVELRSYQASSGLI